MGNFTALPVFGFEIGRPPVLRALKHPQRFIQSFWPMVGQMAYTFRPDRPPSSSAVWSPEPPTPSWDSHPGWRRLRGEAAAVWGRLGMEQEGAPEGGRLRQWLAAEWGLAEARGKGRGLSFSRGPFMLKSASMNAGGPGAQPGEM